MKTFKNSGIGLTYHLLRVFRSRKAMLNLSLCTLIFSCTNENLSDVPSLNVVQDIDEEITLGVLEKEDLQNASLKEKLHYKDYYLTSLMETVLKVNPDFDNPSELKENKNRTAIVSIKELLTDVSDKYVDSSVGKGGGIEALEAFTDLEGETWLPVIKRLRKGDGNTKKAIYLLKSFDESSNKELINAYKLHKNGKLTLIKLDYTEDDFVDTFKVSKSDESVFLVTIEPDSSGNGIPISNYVAPGGGGGGGSGGSNTVFLDIKTMKVKDKKETWIESGDVYFNGYAVWIKSDGSFDTEDMKGSGYNYDYHEVTTIPNKDVGKWKTINYNLTTNSTSASFFYYVIYEHDNWPAPVKTTSFTSGNFYKTLSYRSYNSKYSSYIGTSKENVPGYSIYSSFGNSVVNSTIEYNFSPSF